MESPFSYRYAADIEEDEIDLLGKILDQYDIKYKSVDKVRSAYKITDDDRAYCLKMLGRGSKRAHKSYYLSNALREKGFDNVAPYFFTKDNSYLIKHKKSSFYMTGWINGREVSFKNQEDILESAKFLARFHLAAKGLSFPDEVKIRNRHNNWPVHFNQHVEAVKGFSEKIDRKSKVLGFDLIFKNNMNSFMAEAQFAMDLIDSKQAKRAFEAAEKENYICHDSFYYQNILKDEEGKLYIIDLESSLRDCPMSDLGKFIRRILCKHKFSWDFDLCRRIIEAYDSVRPITHDELYPLLAMIAFPHKYWKFGKKRYIKKKEWTEVDYQKKLIKIIELQSYKIDMVRNFVLFYGIHKEA